MNGNYTFIVNPLRIFLIEKNLKHFYIYICVRSFCHNSFLNCFYAKPIPYTLLKPGWRKSSFKEIAHEPEKFDSAYLKTLYQNEYILPESRCL